MPYLRQQAETKTIILSGPTSTQKSGFAKALFGEYHLVTSVDALKLCVWVKCRNIIGDDFDFTTLKDGSVESLKQLFWSMSTVRMLCLSTPATHRPKSLSMCAVSSQRIA